MARSNLDWEASREEKAIEKWWVNHGFSVKLLKRYMSKSQYELSKDGHVRTYEVMSGITNVKGYLRGFEIFWDLACEYDRLCELVKGGRDNG